MQLERYVNLITCHDDDNDNDVDDDDDDGTGVVLKCHISCISYWNNCQR
jgi:hypothetical protein